MTVLGDTNGYDFAVALVPLLIVLLPLWWNARRTRKAAERTADAAERGADHAEQTAVSSAAAAAEVKSPNGKTTAEMNYEAWKAVKGLQTSVAHLEAGQAQIIAEQRSHAERFAQIDEALAAAAEDRKPDELPTT